MNDTHTSTHAYTLKTFRSPTQNQNKHTYRLLYKPPPLISLSLSELRRNWLIPAWFIWIWIFYTTAQRPKSNYFWTKTFPELSHIIPQVQYRAARAIYLPSASEILTLQSCVWRVCSSHITSFEHYTLYCLTPDTDCVTDIVKIMKPFHLITWFMKPIAILKRQQSWRAQSHMSWRQNQFDSVKSQPQVMRLIWCNRFKVPMQRWWMLKLWQRSRKLN